MTFGAAWYAGTEHVTYSRERPKGKILSINAPGCSPNQLIVGKTDLEPIRNVPGRVELNLEKVQNLYELSLVKPAHVESTAFGRQQDPVGIAVFGPVHRRVHQAPQL
jgi:hypothetical protein